MRILIAIATLEGGGAERQVAYLAPALAALGQRVDLIYCRAGPNLSRIEGSGVVLHHVPVYPFARAAIGPIRQAIGHIRPDIAYFWQRPFVVTGAAAALSRGTPFMLAERTDPGKVASGLKFAANWAAAQLARGVIANSASGEAYWRRNLLGPTRSWHVPNAIPVDELAAVRPDPECRNEIVCVGRLDENKNVMGVVAAVDRARAQGKPVRVALVGDGPQSRALRESIVARRLQDHVRLLGFRADVWPLIKGAQALVSLSRSEGSPNAVLEAAALGIPMVLSDIPAHRVVAAGGAAVRIVDGENADDVANALETIAFLPRSPLACIETVFAPPREIAIRHLEIFERALAASAATPIAVTPSGRL
jgi:glycosyltransferase involved in cell wall biosynthesis